MTATPSIPKSTYLDQRERLARPGPKAPLRAGVRASFEASGVAYGSESVTADLRRGESEPVSWRALEGDGGDRPVIASEKVVRDIMSGEGLVCKKAAQTARKAPYSSYKGEISERPDNLPLREDGTHGFSADEPGRLVVTDVTEFRLDGYKAYLSPAIDCFDGWPVFWRVSRHPDAELTCGMLEDLVRIVGPTEERPLVAHTDGGAVHMGSRWKGACGRPHVTRSMSRKDRGPTTPARRGSAERSSATSSRGAASRASASRSSPPRSTPTSSGAAAPRSRSRLGWKTIREQREELGYAVCETD